MAKILVTGASGFIGRHVIKALMDIDHPQLSFVAACRDPHRLPKDFNGEVRIGDLRDDDYLDRVLVGIDIVCHCAGWTSFLNHPKLSVKYYLDPSVELFNRALEWRVSRFVNLSSLGLAATDQRQDDNSTGKPRPGQPMLNCMIGFEDYLRAHSAQRLSVMNLRAGIYSGRGLQRGLLPVLNRIKQPFYAWGRHAYLPIVDARDLAQAFIRAALSPIENGYQSFNIAGPEQIDQAQLFKYLTRMGQAHQPGFGVPHLLSKSLAHISAYLSNGTHRPAMTGTLNSLLYNPIISIEKAQTTFGYDPQIGWQASINDWLQHPTQALSDSTLMQADE